MGAGRVSYFVYGIAGSPCMQPHIDVVIGLAMRFEKLDPTFTLDVSTMREGIQWLGYQLTFLEGPLRKSLGYGAWPVDSIIAEDVEVPATSGMFNVRLSNAKHVWDRFGKWALERGIDVGRPQVLVVTDYD